MIEFVSKRTCRREALLAMVPCERYCAASCGNCDVCNLACAVGTSSVAVLPQSTVKPAVTTLLDAIEQATLGLKKAWFIKTCMRHDQPWRSGLTHAAANAIVTHVLASRLVRLGRGIAPGVNGVIHQPTCVVDREQAAAFRLSKTELQIDSTSSYS